MDWDTDAAWRKQVERRLLEVGSLVKGNQSFSADRISDVLEQLDELRTELKRVSEELKRVSERQDKIADFLKKHFPKNGG